MTFRDLGLIPPILSALHGQGYRQPSPIQEKAMAAIEKVSKAGGYAVVFDLAAGSTIYIDEAQVTDLLPLVKTELGIK